MNLTAIVPAKNEAKFLPGCLESLQFADQIIVIDDNSSDNTVEIAQQAGATVITHQWSGFSDQKNTAAARATGEWLLFIDADERVSKSLKKEIQHLNPEGVTLYRIPRKNIILGKALQHGGWYPDYQERLVKKAAFIGWEGRLHEHVKLRQRQVKKLKNPIIHLTHRSVTWMLKKTTRYAQIEAALRYEAGHPPVSLKHFISAMGREFWYRAVKKQGFKDGLRGWIEILYQTFNAFIIYFFLWEMQNKSDIDAAYQLKNRVD